MNNQEFLNKLGHKIRILRDNKKLSQDQLAELANSDRTHISNIETGKANPSIIYLKQISDALNIELIELFNFKI